ncbi:MAG: methylmalonyl-CoA mutase family protein [Chloroflexota bacterium]
MDKVETRSWIPVKPLYTPADLNGWNYKNKLGDPGEYPFTRGMPVTHDWESLGASGHYSGFGTPEATNQWLKFLIAEGAMQVSAGALDLPTQIGYDSDHPFALGEVGKSGVAMSSFADFEAVYDGIPTDKIAPSSVVAAIAPIFFAWGLALFEKRGVPQKQARASTQNDPLKEFMCRGTQIFPIQPSVKLTCDVVEYCVRNGLKKCRPLTVCGSHMRQAGASAVQEMGFTLADALVFYDDLLGRGLKVDDFAPYISVFLGGGMDFFEEVCKIRAFRRMWSRTMKERYGSKTPPNIHSRGNGRDFTAQQPLNNIIRGTIELMAAWIGGCPGCETSCYDEALAIPTEESLRLANRTRQIITFESGVLNTTDPFAGSYYVEWLTDELEKRAMELFQKVQDMGGAVPALEQGFPQMEIARSAYEKARQIEVGERIHVGVNKYVTDETLTINLRKVDPKEERRQIARVKKLRKERDNAAVKANLKRLKTAAKEGVNLIPVLIDTVKTNATVGEMCDVLRSVYGEYKAAGL